MPVEGPGRYRLVGVALVKLLIPGVVVSRTSDWRYDLVMVKLPLPVHSELPVRVQVPVIVFPFSVPVRLNVLPVGFPDVTTKETLPVTTLLELVVTLAFPLSVSPETKHVCVVKKLKLDTASDPSLFTENIVTKSRADASPAPPVSCACQKPLTVV